MKKVLILTFLGMFHPFLYAEADSTGFFKTPQPQDEAENQPSVQNQTDQDQVDHDAPTSSSDSSSNKSQNIESGKTPENNTGNSAIHIDESPLVLADRVRIRVGDIILTDRQIAVFYALRQLSPTFAKISSPEEMTKQMARLLAFEYYARNNRLDNLLPGKNEMQKRIDYLNNSLGTTSLAQTVAKIDPRGDLTSTDIKQFSYYQILNEKGFVYALQKDFINKMFTPRQDEIYLLYKQILASSPQVFESPTQLYILGITIAEPTQEFEKKILIQNLSDLKDQIEQESDPKLKEKMFIGGIRRYSSNHLKNESTLGPIDQDLVKEDFPEYSSLFSLPQFGVSNIIESDGFIRLIYIKQKDNGENRSYKDPEIQQKILNVLYDSKGEQFYQHYLQGLVEQFDVDIKDTPYEQ